MLILDILLQCMKSEKNRLKSYVELCFALGYLLGQRPFGTYVIQCLRQDLFPSEFIKINMEKWHKGVCHWGARVKILIKEGRRKLYNSDRNANRNNEVTVGLFMCSIGPILTRLIPGKVFNTLRPSFVFFFPPSLPHWIMLDVPLQVFPKRKTCNCPRKVHQLYACAAFEY